MQLWTLSELSREVGVPYYTCWRAAAQLMDPPAAKAGGVYVFDEADRKRFFAAIGPYLAKVAPGSPTEQK